MKKSVIIIIVLLLLVLGCSVTVVMMATGIITKGTNEDAGSLMVYSNDNTDTKNYIICTLTKTDVELSERVMGTVLMMGDEEKSYSLDNINNNFKLQVKVGDYVKKGEVLFVDNNGKKVIADNNLTVTHIEQEKAFYMEVFQYIDSSIAVSIPEKYQDRINMIEFTTLNDDNEVIPLNLMKIDTNIMDGKITLLLDNCFELFEGSTVEVKIKYDTLEDKISISKEFVFFDTDNKPYIHIVDRESDNVYDEFVNIIAESDENYILSDNLDGYTVGYTIEERSLSD